MDIFGNVPGLRNAFMAIMQCSDSAKLKIIRFLDLLDDVSRMVGFSFRSTSLLHEELVLLEIQFCFDN
jgi:hypothetical protein